MKKLFYIGVLLTIVTLLGACSKSKKGIDNTGKTIKTTGSLTVKNSTTNSKIESSSKSSSKSSTDDLFVSEGKLLEVGQWTNDAFSGGKVTLRKIVAPSKEVILANGFSLIINTVKLLETSEIPTSFLTESAFPDQFIKGNSYATIQIDYSIKNDSDNEINFWGIQYITTDQRQQIEVVSEDLGASKENTFLPKTDIHNNGIICFLNSDTINSITKVTLKTNSVDAQDFSTLAEPATIEIDF